MHLLAFRAATARSISRRIVKINRLSRLPVFPSMNSLYYRGMKNCSGTEDRLRSLRKSPATATCVHAKYLQSSRAASRTTGQKSWLHERPLPRSFPKGTGVIHGPPVNNSPASRPRLTSAIHGRSNFVPMNPRSLGASLKREENWSHRSRSPSRKPSRLDIKISTGEPSTIKAEAEMDKLFPQSDDFSLSFDLDELEASDEEASKNFLLRVNTPITLRRRKLQLSLDPVRESHDEVAKENCSSDPENN